MLTRPHDAPQGMPSLPSPPRVERAARRAGPGLRLGRFGLAIGVVVLAAGCGVDGPSLAPVELPKQPETHLVLRLGERRLYLMDGDPARPLRSFPIAVGREGLETPVGRFQVEEMVEHPEFLKIDKTGPLRVVGRIPPGPDNPLGQRWIGFAHGDGWTVGIHGTPHPELLGRAVSHGCVRMRNEDVVHVYERVRLGTVVIVEP